jgi:hypothetical protein
VALLTISNTVQNGIIGDDTICFVARKPTPDAARHEEVIARLDRNSAQLATLRS